MEKANKKFFRRNWLFITVGVILLFTVCWFCFVQILYSSFLSEFEKIRKNGYPATPEELVKIYPPIPDSKNAAIIYQEAQYKYVEPDKIVEGIEYYPETKYFQKKPFNKVEKHIALYLDNNRKCLELLRKGNQMSDCRYQINYMPEPHSHKLLDWISYRAFNLWKLKIIYYHHMKSPEKITDALMNAFKMINKWKSAPYIYTNTRATWKEIYLCGIITENLDLSVFSDSQLAALSKQIETNDEKSGLKTALITIRCYQLDRIINNPDWMEDSLGNIMAAILRAVRYSGLKYHLLRNIMEIQRKIITASDLPIHLTIKIADKLNKKFYRNYFFLDEVSYRMGEEQNRSAFPRFIKYEARRLMYMRLTRVILAVQRYRLTYKILPAKLSDLVPEFMEAVPIDPFDGKQLRYKITKNRYIVYSVGKDGIDDGGKVTEKYSCGISHDIGITVNIR